MWKNQPHLRVRPHYPEHTFKKIEFKDPADVRYKNVKAVAVWKEDLTTVAYYILLTNEGHSLGRVTHLRYIEEAYASKTKV